MVKKENYSVCLYNDSTNSVEHVMYVLKTMFGWDDTQTLNCVIITESVGHCTLRSFDQYEDALYVCKVLESKNLNVKIINEND